MAHPLLVNGLRVLAQVGARAGAAVLVAGVEAAADAIEEHVGEPARETADDLRRRAARVRTRLDDEKKGRRKTRGGRRRGENVEKVEVEIDDERDCP